MVHDEARLSGLLIALRGFDDPTRLERDRVPLPENTGVWGDDLNDYMTRDAEAQEQRLLIRMIDRLEKNLENLQTQT